MNFDYEKAIAEAMTRVMDKTAKRIDAQLGRFIHDWLTLNDEIDYQDAKDLEYRAFGCFGIL